MIYSNTQYFFRNGWIATSDTQKGKTQDICPYNIQKCKPYFPSFFFKMLQLNSKMLSMIDLFVKIQRLEFNNLFFTILWLNFQARCNDWFEMLRLTNDEAYRNKLTENSISIAGVNEYDNAVSVENLGLIRLDVPNFFPIC